MYRVFIFPSFKKKIKTLFSKQEIIEIENFIENQLQIKGEYIGKPLNSPHLREKKIKGKRIYYLVYKEIAVILLVNASDKKSQQQTIDEIRKLLPEYKKYVYELYKSLL